MLIAVATVTLWIGTRKGAFALRSDERRRSWTLSSPQFLGHTIHHIVQDPRDPKSLLMAAKTGHLGPTVYRSVDRGRKWREAATPPAFRKAVNSEPPRAVERVFWLTPGHEREPGVWYAGTSPAGLFRTEDGGEHWAPVAGFNDHPMRAQWAPGSGTPDGELLHSILVDPRDARHLYLAISIGGVFESTDGGLDWMPMNDGVAADFLPDQNVAFGHDPHCLVLHPLEPDRLYQQNHCGIYRLDRPMRRWQRIGRTMPERIGDLGIVDCRAPARGLRCCARRCAPTCTLAPQCILAPPTGRSGPVPMPARRGVRSPGACRRSTPSPRHCIEARLSCTVNVASPLRDYTGGAATVSAQGATLEEVLLDLDRRFPGMRFRMIDEQQRIRRHMRIFIASREAHELATPVGRNEPVHLICALSGG